MTAERPSDELIARVLSGNAHPGDAAAVASWVGNDPIRRGELERLRAVWASTADGSWDIDRAWVAVARDVASDRSRTTPTPIKHDALGRRGVVWRIAAALILTAGLAGAWLTLRPGGAAATETYVTAAGERRELTLSDGSTVVMAPRSTVTIGADFGRGSRKLTLDGEAWFSVAHQPNAPLVVETASHVIRDIGTVFTVWARAGREVRVAVAEGEVAVRERTSAVRDEQRLVAGDVARFAADTISPTRLDSKQPLDTLASWRDGVLDVVAEPADRVLAQLAAWYGVSLRLADTSVNSRTITATLSLDSLDQALEVVALLLDVTVERAPNGIVLRPRP